MLLHIQSRKPDWNDQTEMFLCLDILWDCWVNKTASTKCIVLCWTGKSIITYLVKSASRVCTSLHTDLQLQQIRLCSKLCQEKVPTPAALTTLPLHFPIHSFSSNASIHLSSNTNCLPELQHLRFQLKYSPRKLNILNAYTYVQLWFIDLTVFGPILSWTKAFFKKELNCKCILLQVELLQKQILCTIGFCIPGKVAAKPQEISNYRM